MKRTEIINHKGKSFFYMNFSGLRKIEEIEQLIDESKQFIRFQKEKSLLTLTNIDGMHFNNEIKNLFSEFLKGNKPYVIAGAVVGLSGLQRIVYNGIMKLTGRDVRSFENLNIAKEWLCAYEQVDVMIS